MGSTSSSSRINSNISGSINSNSRSFYSSCTGITCSINGSTSNTNKYLSSLFRR